MYGPMLVHVISYSTTGLSTKHKRLALRGLDNTLTIGLVPIFLEDF